ncbi:YaaL family protein [Lactobacillus jensenii]|jgi:hypothetical protein|uniref:DUF2508 family protein n=1 Tax=Lactobacillus jensenii TaxID=109790 RepID=A0A5N1IAQ1_LACJE|nr:YaaL family protein [Lactobacillus jensenii]EEQ68965.1 hypothetical protein LBJG_01393 [Lactobacillus jensenii 1153]APT14298.1 hypothetical protein BUE77_02245 [Lactobacillus jensenii]EEQ24346.1 hypothetical protein LACJE0001_0228 [Lactobacillus jensenii 269-3]EEX27380.1 hypothetical protein HMPREF0527_01012 [Lactobacillus jensenii SJ-7A-US]KAA9235382.1 DUF2508 family protein [Lactobacillus jensenii]
MIFGKKTQVKEIGDQHLMVTISKLQRQLLNEQELDPTTVDYSEDNIMTSKILKAKYSFLYSVARQRHTKSSITNNAITQ